MTRMFCLRVLPNCEVRRQECRCYQTLRARPANTRVRWDAFGQYHLVTPPPPPCCEHQCENKGVRSGFSSISVKIKDLLSHLFLGAYALFQNQWILRAGRWDDARLKSDD
jgi:hypothetical protein